MAHCSGAARLTAPVPVPHLSVAAGARQPLQRRWRQWWCPRQAAAAVRQHEGGKAARLPVPARAKHLGEAARPGGMSMRLRRPAAALAPNPPPPPRHPLRPACRDGSLPEDPPVPAPAAAADRSAGWGGVPSTAPRADPGSTRELQPGLLAAPSHLDGGGSAAAPPPPHADWSGQGERPRLARGLGGTEWRDR
jgi:hypothetical protein